jgi:putative serine protease PepD
VDEEHDETEATEPAGTDSAPFIWRAGPDGLEPPPAPSAPVAEAGVPARPLLPQASSAASGGGPDSKGHLRPSRGRRALGLLALGLACALVGGLVGGLVARRSGNANVTILRNAAKPGGAVLPSGMSIPTLVKQVLPSIVSIDAKSAGSEDQGTGMIISADGMVITNNHVIAIAASGGTITVTRSGSTEALSTDLVGRDPSNDVALLKIKGASALPPVTLGDSSKVEVGDAAVAIGNALGLAAGTPTVTSGIISALGRTVTAGDSSGSSTETLTNMIQTDAAINPGNSGGALLDAVGDVIGMNTAVAGTLSSGESAQNIGFAIPSSRIESLLPELEKGGTSTTPTSGSYLGVDITTLTDQLRSQYGIVPTSGALILNVLSSSPAATAGLRAGDVIVGIDGHKITTADQVVAYTKARAPGTVVKISYARGSQIKTTSATLATAPQ